MAVFNVLKQDGRSISEYIDHVNELHDILGNDFQSLLAMRFIDGIEDTMTRQSVNAAVDEPYILSAITSAYRKATKSIRRLESYQEKKTKSSDDIVGGNDPMRELLHSQERLAAMHLNSQAKILQQFQEIVKPAKLTTPTYPPQAPGNIPRPVTANDHYQRRYQRDWVPTYPGIVETTPS